MPLTCFPDTTVLINFALIGRLDVLDALLHNRFWSATVSDECAKQYTKHGVAASYAQAQTIFGTPVYPTADESRRMLTIRGLHNYGPEDLVSAVDFLTATAATIPFVELAGGEFALHDIELAFSASSSLPGLRTALIP